VVVGHRERVVAIGDRVITVTADTRAIEVRYAPI
jgi:hypothetical protein